jgi:hypothetical protein
MKLLSVKHSDKPEKKWMATFETDTGRKKVTHFGAKGMDDYTIKGDDEQRARYRKRHQKDLLTMDPTRAGMLSYYLLWGDSKSLQSNLATYRKRFNL